MAKVVTSKQRRQWRVRKGIKKGVEKNSRARLSVYRSGKHIYAQVIDDAKGVTVASASSLAAGLKAGGNKDAAAAVGKAVAELAKKAGVAEVVFDRGSYKYHGRVKSLAEAAREAGLSF